MTQAGGLLEVHGVRHVRKRLRRLAHVLGERARSKAGDVAEDGVTRLEVCDACAHRLDRASHVDPQLPVTAARRAKAQEELDEAPARVEPVEIGTVDRRGLHPHEDLTRGRSGLG